MRAPDGHARTNTGQNADGEPGRGTGAGTAGLVAAARAVATHLDEVFPLELWMVTRVEVADQVVVAAAGDWSRTWPAGTVLPWLGSFGLHLSAGTAPRVAPRTDDVPLYQQAATGRWARVRGFTGVPLHALDGDVIGTVCGFADRPDHPSVTDSAATLPLLGTLFSTIAGLERDRDQAVAELATSRELIETDALTGLSNRRGWNNALAQETERCHRYHEPAGIICLDLDELKAVNDSRGHAAGDALLRATADILAESCRPNDVVARTGGDEFAVLAVEADHDAVQALTTRISQTLERSGVAASVAGVTHVSAEHLSDTWVRADRDMYRRKRSRRWIGQEPRR